MSQDTLRKFPRHKSDRSQEWDKSDRQKQNCKIQWLMPLHEKQENMENMEPRLGN